MKLPIILLTTLMLASAQTTHAPVPGPYRADADAHKDLAAAQARARTGHKFVMVIFGANWCEDCQVLHRSLDSADARDYVEKHFEIVSVDIGDDGKKNADVAQSLGVTLAKGVPAAAFFNWDGTPVGRTDNGELEPSRTYQPKQILHFLQEIVDHHKITTPK
jgi:thiol:disulfide interchange protein